MGDDLFLAPEITMHEEPGEIRIHQSGGVAVEIDDDEQPIHTQQQAAYPFGPDGIPPEISITKVKRSMPPLPKGPQSNGNSFLKVRNDLGSGMPPRGQQSSRPPPLLRIGAQGGLPPMPRLKFGGPVRPVRSMQPRTTNPLAGMLNMMHGHPGMPGYGSGGPGMTMNNQISPMGGYPMTSVPGLVPNAPMHSRPVRPPVTRPPPPPPPSTTSILRQQRMPHLKNTPTTKRSSMDGDEAKAKRRNTLPTNDNPLAQLERHVGGPFAQLKPSQPQKPKTLPPFINTGRKNKVPTLKGVQGLKNLTPLGKSPKNVQVPPPLKNERRASTVDENGSTAQQQLIDTLSSSSASPPRSFPELDISVKTVVKQPVTPKPATKLSEVDDLEKLVEGELEELDDVEPDEQFPSSLQDVENEPSPAVVTNGDPPKRKVETLQFVRRADGKGFVRKNGPRPVRTSSSLLKLKTNKRKKKPFRGGNYRFDGSTITKKRPAPKRSSHSGADAAGNDQPPSFLAYLGIQRKDSTDSNKNDSVKSESESKQSNVGPKAKKSFKPSNEENFQAK